MGQGKRGVPEHLPQAHSLAYARFCVVKGSFGARPRVSLQCSYSGHPIDPPPSPPVTPVTIAYAPRTFVSFMANPPGNGLREGAQRAVTLMQDSHTRIEGERFPAPGCTGKQEAKGSKQQWWRWNRYPLSPTRPPHHLSSPPPPPTLPRTDLDQQRQLTQTGRTKRHSTGHPL